MADMNAEEIESTASLLVAAGKYSEAIPYMEQVLARIDEIKDQGVLKAIGEKVQYLKFVMAFCHVASGRHAEAIELFDAYLAEFPDSLRLQQVLTLKAYCERVDGRWNDAVASLRRILSTFLLAPRERDEMEHALARSLFESGDHEGAYEQLSRLAFNAQDPAVRMESISLLLTTIFKLGRTDSLYALVPLLQGQISPARYSLDFNLRAIETADTLIAEESHPPAFALLKLCRPRQEIADGLALIRQRLLSQQDTLRKGKSTIMENFQQMVAVETRLARVEAEIAALENAASFDEGLRYRLAAVLHKLGLFYEAYWAYDGIVADFPESESLPEAMLAMMLLAEQLDLGGRVLAAAEQLVSEHPESPRAAEAIFALAYQHQKDENIEKMIGVLQEAIEQKIVTRNTEDHGHALYLLGFAHAQMENFDEARQWLDAVREETPTSKYNREADYWRAFLSLSRGEYEDARRQFDDFVEKYEAGAYIEDATFRRALSAFGEGDLEGSKMLAGDFVAKYPTSSLRGEAQVLLGDACGGLGQLDEAIAQYALVEQFTSRPDLVHAAVFNAAEIMKADGRWQEIVGHFQSYLDRYGDEAKHTMANYGIGQALEALGREDEMLDRYWSGFLRFADDRTATGADVILRDYLAKSPPDAGGDVARRLEKALEETGDGQGTRRLRLLWAQSAHAARMRELRETRMAEAAAAQEALEARKAAGDAGTSGEIAAAEQAAIEASQAVGPEVEIVVPPDFSAADLDHGSPAVLAWIAALSLERGEPELALNACRRIIGDFPTTAWTVEALMHIGTLELGRGNKEAARLAFREIYDYHPTSALAGAAAMRLADLARDEGALDEAAALYEEILLVREWRGPLWPEALFNIGRIRLEQGNAEQAFAYFQRVYVLYEQHTDWASKAYLESGKCLEILGRPQDAAQTYREMLSNQALASTEAATEAAKRLQELDPQPAAAAAPPA